MITQELVKSLFNYDSESGGLIWANSPNNRVKAGSVAGTEHRGYLRTRIKRKHLLVHRLVFLYHNGYMPEFIDHIDNNRSNNKIENLRPCTPSQNSCNSKLSKANSTGFKGVSWLKSSKKYIAQIKSKNTSYNLGLFDDPEVADQVLRIERLRLHGKFSNDGGYL